MKYIKTFEKIRKKIKVGDYVVMKSIGLKNEYQGIYYNGFLNFIDNTIGKVVYKNVGDDFLTIEYDNIPDSLKGAFQKNKYAGKIKYYTYFKIRDVIEYSENKDNLKFILTANKYNL